MNLTIYRDPQLAEGTTLIYFFCIKVEILVHKNSSRNSLLKVMLNQIVFKVILPRPEYSKAISSPQKGGDPAAPSGTATLLRLRPSHLPHSRHLPPRRVSPATSSVSNFHDVTGGVYKARERIHRSILICGYQQLQVHAGEFQPTIPIGDSFIGLAPSCDLATVCTVHCSVCVALGVRAMMI